jgi:hypothetical protein
MAIEMGELSGYTHLADLDHKNELAHLKNALQAGDAYAEYAYGHYLQRHAKTDEEKASHLHWMEKAAKKVTAMPHCLWPCTTSTKAMGQTLP